MLNALFRSIPATGDTTVRTDPDDGNQQLSELRQGFIELKATLDRNIRKTKRA
jgi:hypothetical protein